MTLGQGAAYATSTVQKINTTSSTEAEVVGLHEVLPQILWTRYFLESQGYGVEESVVYQDNQSAMLLEKNGRGSSSKWTRHINIRYFFVADRIASKEVKVEYCPKGDMLADYFTKPLQGTLFRRFRDMIMNGNLTPTTSSVGDCRSVLNNEERLTGDLVDVAHQPLLVDVAHQPLPNVVDVAHEPAVDVAHEPWWTLHTNETKMRDRQTGQDWTLAVHRKDMAQRNRYLRKRILEKRGSRVPRSR